MQRLFGRHGNRDFGLRLIKRFEHRLQQRGQVTAFRQIVQDVVGALVHAARQIRLRQGRQQRLHGFGAQCDQCPADIDGSGAVDSNDLLVILDEWGPCPDCPGDLNGDDEVDFNDLLIVLDNWGPCP